MGRGSHYAWSRHYVTHAAPNGIEGRYRGMTDSISYAGCGQRATAQRHWWARANEHTAATTNPRGGETARRVKIIWESRVPGRADSQWNWNLEPSRADGLWGWNLTDRVASARDLNISRAGPGALVPAPSARVGPPAKTLRFEILDFSQLSNITKRNIPSLAIFVRNEMSWIVIFCHTL